MARKGWTDSILICIVFVAIWTNCSAAERDNSGGASSGKAHLRVLVIDDQRRPVPYATLWVMYRYKNVLERSVTDMDRLLARYGRDYDLVPAGSLKPISAVHVFSADAQGVYEDQIKENDLEGGSELQVIVGGVKRGFRSASGAASVVAGATRELVLELGASAAQPTDADLIELDEIRSEANRVSIFNDIESGAVKLEGLHVRLESIAATFEKQGKKEQAAIAYFGLAHLPSIDRAPSNGRMTCTGYTKGYDSKSPTRRMNMGKALQLGSELPLLRFATIIDRLSQEGGMIWADATKSEARLRFISDIATNLKRTRGYVFPSTLLVLSQAYSAEGDHSAACATMHEAYRFEPRTYATKDWPSLFESVTLRATKQFSVNRMPGFVCSMPIDTLTFRPTE